jgi:hypothetical protein
MQLVYQVIPLVVALSVESTVKVNYQFGTISANFHLMIPLQSTAVSSYIMSQSLNTRYTKEVKTLLLNFKSTIFNKNHQSISFQRRHDQFDLMYNVIE